MTEKMQAMVLAAGLGTRMRPLTNDCPKPLIEVNGKKLIDYAFDTLRESGVQQAVVNSHYLAEQLRAHLADIDDLSIEESYEPELLETGGGIAKALPKLGDAPFCVLNSDTICLSAPDKPVLQQLQAKWDANRYDLLMLLMPTQRTIGYDGAGDFVSEQANGESRYRRRREGERGEYVVTGVQMLQPSLFQNCPAGAFSMNVIYNRYQRDADGFFERIGFVIHEGDWLHVGSPQEREEAERFLSR